MVEAESGGPRGLDEPEERLPLDLDGVGAVEVVGSPPGVGVEAVVHGQSDGPCPGNSGEGGLGSHLGSVLGPSAVIRPGRREVAGLEDEPDLVEEPPIEPLIDPGDLRDLVVSAERFEDFADDPE